MNSITNSAYSILMLLAECDSATGYDINKRIEERGFRQWADIGMTSIYKGLRKLERDQYVSGETDVDKTGKGPTGTRYRISELGLNTLKKEARFGLANGRERERHFALGLAASFLFEHAELCEMLRNRIDFLQGEIARIESKQTRGIPEHARMLFEYSFHHIRSDIQFSKNLINQMEENYYEN